MTERLLRLLRREDGISLVMAIGVLGVLTPAGATAVYFSTAHNRGFAFSKGNASAYGLAEAG